MNLFIPMPKTTNNEMAEYSSQSRKLVAQFYHQLFLLLVSSTVISFQVGNQFLTPDSSARIIFIAK